MKPVVVIPLVLIQLKINTIATMDLDNLWAEDKKCLSPALENSIFAAGRNFGNLQKVLLVSKSRLDVYMFLIMYKQTSPKQNKQ